MLEQLIHDKINEVFFEYQEANHIISGDIQPLHEIELESLVQQLKVLIEKICSYQPRNYDYLTPSWFIYADSKGNAYSKTFNGDICDDFFFTTVSRKIAFDDIDNETVQKIYHKGKEVEYVGWQPGMKIEFQDLDGNTVWVGEFPEWDH